jgi:hypothetical protein
MGAHVSARLLTSMVMRIGSSTSPRIMPHNPKAQHSTWRACCALRPAPDPNPRAAYLLADFGEVYLRIRLLLLISLLVRPQQQQIRTSE